MGRRTRGPKDVFSSRGCTDTEAGVQQENEGAESHVDGETHIADSARFRLFDHQLDEFVVDALESSQYREF